MSLHLSIYQRLKVRSIDEPLSVSIPDTVNKEIAAITKKTQHRQKLKSRIRAAADKVTRLKFNEGCLIRTRQEPEQDDPG